MPHTLIVIIFSLVVGIYKARFKLRPAKAFDKLKGHLELWIGQVEYITPFTTIAYASNWCRKWCQTHHSTHGCSC